MKTASKDCVRLKSAGWKRLRSGLWRSPYTKAKLTEEHAVRLEIIKNHFPKIQFK